MYNDTCIYTLYCTSPIFFFFFKQAGNFSESFASSIYSAMSPSCCKIITGYYTIIGTCNTENQQTVSATKSLSMKNREILRRRKKKLIYSIGLHMYTYAYVWQVLRQNLGEANLSVRNNLKIMKTDFFSWNPSASTRAMYRIKRDSIISSSAESCRDRK